MAYDDYGNNIYSRLRTILLSGVGRVGIVNRHILPTEDSELEFVHKYKRGIAIRLNSDAFNDEGSESYNERMYNYTLRCMINDSDDDQNGLIDLAEAVKYTLEQNKNDSSDNWQYLRVINIDYAEPEELNPIKYCDIEIEALKDG